MKKYKEYFKYIIEHKKNVFVECWKEGLYIHAITHDLSKFSPLEFFAYADWFYGEYGVKCLAYDDIFKNYCKNERKKRFDRAWEHHYKHNKHHWNYWTGKEIPEKYIKQMICDWRAMSRKFGDTAQEFYMKNHDKVNIVHNSRVLLEFNLGLIDGVCLVSNMNWKEVCKRQGKTMEEDLRELGYIK